MKNFSSYAAKAIILIVLSGINLSLCAQNTLQIVKGTIRNTSNYEPISFAVVKNQMIGAHIISDEQGRYSIPVNRGDLLKITAIGFEDGFYIVNDTSNIISNYPIQLKPRIYELKEFTLTPYKTILQFKHAFAQLRLPEENLIPELNLNGIIISTEQAEYGQLNPIIISGPISFFYNTFSHNGKMIKKYNSLVSNDKVNTIIYTRLNYDFVSSIVAIHSKIELEDFIDFCKFDLSFIINASDYELIASIQKKHLEYINKKSLLPKSN